MIPYGKQHIDKKDIAEITKVLRSSFLTTGPKVKKFEHEIKKFTGSKFSSACNSGTSALYLAFSAINIKPGDVIIMPGINFIASFNICKLFKAKIYLADVDSSNGLMTKKNVLECIKKYNLKKIKALVTMHLGGNAEYTGDFYKLKRKFKFFVIEDSCHAFGSEYSYNARVYKVGCAKHADISTFSFHPIKSITTAEGGAITTNNKELFKKIHLFRSHGMIKFSNKHWEYNIKSSGLNFRLSDLNCALGLSQIKKIKKFLKKRDEIVKFYNNHFKKYESIIKIPKITKNQNAWHLYIVSFNFKNIFQKDLFFRYLKKNGIIAQFHYKPIYRFSVGGGLKKMPGCEKYYKNAVSLPIFFDLTKERQKKIIKVILKFFKKII